MSGDTDCLLTSLWGEEPRSGCSVLCVDQLNDLIHIHIFHSEVNICSPDFPPDLQLSMSNCHMATSLQGLTSTHPFIVFKAPSSRSLPVDPSCHHHPINKARNPWAAECPPLTCCSTLPPHPSIPPLPKCSGSIHPPACSPRCFALDHCNSSLTGFQLEPFPSLNQSTKCCQNNLSKMQSLSCQS